MSLHGRIIGGEGIQKINVHAFHGALRLWADNITGYTRVSIIGTYNINAAEETELDWLKSRFVDATDKNQFINDLHILMIHAESKLHGMDNQSTFQAAVLEIV